jgi:hypothetical protein
MINLIRNNIYIFNNFFLIPIFGCLLHVNMNDYHLYKIFYTMCNGNKYLLKYQCHGYSVIAISMF